MISNVVAHHQSNDAITLAEDYNEKKIDGVLACLWRWTRAQRVQ
jgi:hypothetical protein